MKPAWKTILFTLLKIAVPIAIIGFLFARIEPDQWEQLANQPKNYWLMVAALGISLVALSLSFVRWWALVHCQGIELSITEAFRLGAIGYLLSIVSPGSVGGDLFKAIFLAKRRPGKRVEAVASVVVDRGVGLYGLLLVVALVLLVTNPQHVDSDYLSIRKIKWVTAALVGIATTVMAVLILGGRGVDRMVRWGERQKWIGPIVHRLGPPLRTFHSHPFVFGLAILISMTVQSMFACSMFLIARGTFADSPTLGQHLLIVPIGMLVSALPITFGGIGLYEAAIDQLYKIVPAEPSEASGLMVALIFEVVKLLMAGLGMVFYFTADKEVRHSLEEAEDQSEG